MIRYFRASPQVYESVRNAIDAEWGLPSHGQQTAFATLDAAPQVGGFAYLAVYQYFCEYEAIASRLPQLIAAGLVQEITAEEYAAALPVAEL